MAGMTLDILADTRQAQKAIGDVSEALDTVADSLDDVVKDSDKGTERMEKDFRELARTAEAEGRKAYGSLRENIQKTTKVSNESMKEVKQEALQNASETLSSFDGSVTSFAGAIQGTLGGLVIGLQNNIPAAAGVAAGAAGIGLIASAIVGLQEETQRLKEHASEAFQSMVSDGLEAFHTLNREARLADIFDPNGELNGKAQTAAEQLKLPFETVARAMVGYEEDIAAVDARVAELLEKAGSIAGKEGNEAQQARDRINALAKPIRDQITAVELAEQRYNQYKDSVVRDTDEMTHQVRTYKDELDNVPSTVTTKLIVDTSKLDRYLADLKRNGILVTADVAERYTKGKP